MTTGRESGDRVEVVRALSVAALTAATLLATATGNTGAAGPLILVFVLVAPGLAWVGLLRLRDPLFELVLGVALSASMAGLLTTLQLFVKLWSPDATLVVLMAVAVVGLMLDPILVPRSVWSGLAATIGGLKQIVRRIGVRGRQAPHEVTTAAGSTAGDEVPSTAVIAGGVSRTATEAAVDRAPGFPSATEAVDVAAGSADAAHAADEMAAQAADGTPASVTAALIAAPGADGAAAAVAAPAADGAAIAAAQVASSRQRGRPSAEPARRRSSRRSTADPLPPPPVVMTRRLGPDALPEPEATPRQRRAKAVADETADDLRPTGALRDVVRGVVGDIVDRRDGKR